MRCPVLNLWVKPVRHRLRCYSISASEHYEPSSGPAKLIVGEGDLGDSKRAHRLQIDWMKMFVHDHTKYSI